MPYIKPEVRDRLEPHLYQLFSEMNEDPAGTLNYVVTRLVDLWIGQKPCYGLYNAAIGVLECAKIELYRRQVAPYEDEKREENGDVYLTR